MEAPSQFLFYFFAMNHFDQPIRISSKYKFFVWSHSAYPSAHLYNWEQENIWQTYWIKVCCYWEHLGEHIQNLGTCVNIIDQCS